MNGPITESLLYSATLQRRITGHKNGQLIQLPVRVTPAVVEQLNTIMRRKGTSMNKCLREAIDLYIKLEKRRDKNKSRTAEST